MRKCPACNAVIENERAKFCKKCGARLAPGVNNVKPNRGDTLRVKLTRERCEDFYLVVEWDGVNVDTLKTFPTTYVRKMTEPGNHKLVFYPRTVSQGSFASIVPRFNIDVQ